MTDVRGPDGRIIRFPEGTPPAKINQVMASIYKEKPKKSVSEAKKVIGSSGLDQVNSVLLGAWKGINELGSGLLYENPVGRAVFGDETVESARKTRSKQYKTLRDTFIQTPMPSAETVGQIGSTIPLAAAKVPAAVAKAVPFVAKAVPAVTRGIQGTLAGLAVREPEDDAGRSAAIGATANVVLPPVANAMMRGGATLGRKVIPQGVREAIGGAGRKVVGALDDVGEAGYNALAPRIGRTPLPPSRPPVATPAAPVAALSPEAARRAANFKAAGVREPTTAMVTRDPQAWTFEREASKNAEHGGDLIKAFTQVADDLDRSTRKLVRAKGGTILPEDVGSAVQKALAPARNQAISGVRAAEASLASSADDIVRAKGGAPGQEAAGANVRAILDAKQSEMQAVTGRLYTNIREQRGEVPVGQLNKFRDAIDDPEMTDNPIFDQMRDGIMRRLNRFGMAGTSGLLRKDAVANVTQAEELRKFVGKLGDGKEPSVRMMRKQLIDALDDDVVGVVGDDAFKHARAAAKARFDEFSKTYAGKVAEGAVAPEKLVPNIMGRGTTLEQVRQVRGSLLSGTPEQVARGQDAWQKIGAQAADDLFNSARNADGRIVGEVLRKKFVQAAPKMRELLSAEEYRNLVRLVNSTRDRTAETTYNAFRATLPGRIAEGGVAPEKLVKNILSDGTSLADIKALRTALGTGEAGATAWNRVGAQALDDMLKNSRIGDDALSGARLSKNFAKAAPKLRVLLEPSEFKQLQRIVAAAKDSSVAPNFSSVNYSNSASAIGNMFAKENPVGRTTIKNVLQHLGAFFAVGPAGNIGLAVAKGVAADRAKMKAAQAMLARVQMAKSPAAAAKAVAEMEARASRDKAFAAALKRLQDFTNNMPGVFANAASPPE